MKIKVRAITTEGKYHYKEVSNVRLSSIFLILKHYHVTTNLTYPELEKDVEKLDELFLAYCIATQTPKHEKAKSEYIFLRDIGLKYFKVVRPLEEYKFI